MLYNPNQEQANTTRTLERNIPYHYSEKIERFLRENPPDRDNEIIIIYGMYSHYYEEEWEWQEQYPEWISCAVLKDDHWAGLNVNGEWDTIRLEDAQKIIIISNENPKDAVRYQP